MGEIVYIRKPTTKDATRWYLYNTH